VCARARTGYSGRKLCRHSLILAWGPLGYPLRMHKSMRVSAMHSQIMGVSVAASHLFTHTKPHPREDEALRQRSASGHPDINQDSSLAEYDWYFAFLFLFPFCVANLEAGSWRLPVAVTPSKQNES